MSLTVLDINCPGMSCVVVLYADVQCHSPSLTSFDDLTLGACETINESGGAADDFDITSSCLQQVRSIYRSGGRRQG